jgi:hypothetical protein
MSITQVRSIFLNMFFGVSVNAADGISAAASGQVNMISASMTQALNPQLVKSEGSGNRQKMLRLTEMATKFSIFLFALFAIPVIIETPYLLNLWLKTVPQFTIIFCQLILINLFIEKFTFEITTSIRAIGEIRNLTIAEAILFGLNVPFAYLFFSYGYPPYSIFYLSIAISLLVFLNRLYFGKRIAGMDIKSFLKNGIFPNLFPIFFATMLAWAPHFYLKESFLRLIITTIISLVVMTTIFWFFGLKRDEAQILRQITNSIFQKVGLIKKS